MLNSNKNYIALIIVVQFMPFAVYQTTNILSNYL